MRNQIILDFWFEQLSGWQHHFDMGKAEEEASLGEETKTQQQQKTAPPQLFMQQVILDTWVSNVSSNVTSSEAAHNTHPTPSPHHSLSHTVLAPPSLHLVSTIIGPFDRSIASLFSKL